MTTHTPELHRVWLPYAVFGIVVQGGYVRSAAPIGRWMVGKELVSVKSWAQGKGGDINFVCINPKQGAPL